MNHSVSHATIQARGPTDRKDPLATPSLETALIVTPRRGPAFVTPVPALPVKTLPEGNERLYEIKWLHRADETGFSAPHLS